MNSPSFLIVVSDFGLEHLVEIARQTNFPWLMSNVRDRHTGRLLAEGKESLIINWGGRKVCRCTCEPFPSDSLYSV